MAKAELHAPKPKATTTTLTAVRSTTVADEIVFQANVQPVKRGGARLTGTVVFKDGSSTIGTVPVGGSFTLSTGPKTVTATYSGDTNYAPSTSKTLTAPFTTPPPVPATVTISSFRDQWW